MMKIAPIMWEMKREQSAIRPVLVHTGQHYDAALNDIFLSQLRIGVPDYHLGVGLGSPCSQIGQIITRLEEVLVKEKPDLVLVVGDVNSTIAAALTSVKAGVPVAHVEAGLRSFDRTMPEELNRLATDAISDLLFVTEPSGIENLRREGVDTFVMDGAPVGDVSPAVRESIARICNGSGPRRCGVFVGNVMIDTLLAMKEHAEEDAHVTVPDGDYALLTLHRPANVDDPEAFRQIISALSLIAEGLPILFPCHPRTLSRIGEFGMGGFFKQAAEDSPAHLARSINLVKPLGYLEFLKLMSRAAMVLTDSGGIQEETTILGVPCFTLRDNTERPITLEMGTNILTGTSHDAIVNTISAALAGPPKTGARPPLWDGKAAERIVKILELARFS